MPRSHHLLRLAFAAIWRAPEGPPIAGTDGVQRIPELGGDAGIRWILQHSHSLAVLDLPADFASELKIISTIIDGPGAIRLHQDAMIGGCDQLLQAKRLLAWKQADVGHSNHRQTIPAFGAQRSTGAILADGVRGFARTEISRK